MGRRKSTRTCTICGQGPVIKNGTRNGRIRYRCKHCGQDPYRDEHARPDITALAIFTQYLHWILGKNSQAEIAGNTGRTLRRQWSWCWTIPTPTLDITGEVYDQVFIDGIYLAYHWCLLIAHDGTHVITWQWCHRENAPAYTALLSRLAPPDLITTDGHGGALKALKTLWPDVPVQRCLIHVHRNNLRDLTSRPNTHAGKALLALSQRLLKVSSKEDAAIWTKLLMECHTTYEDFFKTRTWAKDVPIWQRRTRRTWWYTHGRDRRVYQRLTRLTRQGVLFHFLDFNPARERTTNPIESFNHQIRSLLAHHPGMPEDHMIAAVDWLCYTHTANPKPARQILKEWEHNGRPARRIIPTKNTPPIPEPDGPARYGTGLSAEEGLWTRKGWAGHTN